MESEIAERSAAIRVLVDVPRPSPGRLAASAAVLIVPLLAAAGRLRMAAGTPTTSPIKAAEAAGELVGVSCRYVGDASRLRDRDPAAFAKLLDGSMSIQQAAGILKRGRR